MSFWKDGTSNQILIGEKFIPKSFVGTCGEGTHRSYCTDCSIFVFGYANTPAAARSFYGHFAKSSAEDDDKNNNNAVSVVHYHTAGGKQWGGIHPGVGNFLLGDGAVRTLANTTPTGQGSLFHYLGHTNDGNAVSIP
jgi:hypothetical protein